MAKVVGEVAIEVGADVSPLVRAMARVEGIMGSMKGATDKISRSLDNFSRRAEAVGKRMSMVSAAMAAAGGGMLAFAKMTAQAGGEIKRFSQISGTGTTQFQRWAAGAKSVGIEQDKLADILKDVNDKVGDFQETGGGAMADFFENIAPKVGVTADAFKDLSGADALQLYVSSLEKAGASQQQMTFYMEALASDATGLIPLLKNGGAEMGRFGDAAQAAGAVMSGNAIAASEKFNERFGALMNSVQGLRNRLGEVLLPVMTRFVDVINEKVVPALDWGVAKLGEFIQWFGDLPAPIQEAVGVVAAALGAAGPIALALGVLAGILSSFIAAAGPWGLLIAAIAGGVAAWQAWGDGIKAAVGGALDWLGGKFQTFLDFLQKIIDKAVAVKDAVAGALSIGSTEMNSGSGYGGMSGAGDSFGSGAFGGNPYDYDPTMKAPTSGGASAFQSMGASAAAGFGLGMAQQFELMREGFGNSAQVAVDAVRERLQINSPSRVFQEIGQFVGQGMAQGITDSQAMVAQASGILANSAVTSTEGAVSSILGSLSTLFNGSKKLAIAQALINTWQGATEALKLPWPQNLAAFTKTVATGMNAVRNIRSASSGGGGGGGAGGGGSAAAAPMPIQRIDVAWNGPAESRNGLQSLLDQLNDAAARGLRVDARLVSS